MNDQNHKGISPLTAGITGMILGVVGSTLAITFADEGTRNRITKKAKDATDNLLKWSDQTINNVQQKGYDVRKDLADKIDPNHTKTKTAEPERAEHTSEEKMMHN